MYDIIQSISNYKFLNHLEFFLLIFQGKVLIWCQRTGTFNCEVNGSLSERKTEATPVKELMKFACEQVDGCHLLTIQIFHVRRFTINE